MVWFPGAFFGFCAEYSGISHQQVTVTWPILTHLLSHVARMKVFQFCHLLYGPTKVFANLPGQNKKEVVQGCSAYEE